MKNLYNEILKNYGNRTSSIVTLSMDFGLKPYQTRKLTQAAGYHNTIRTNQVSYTDFINNKDVVAIQNFIRTRSHAQVKTQAN